LVIRGAEDAAKKHGYNLLLCNSDDILEKEEQALELLLSKRVDGILLTKTSRDFTPSLRRMIAEVNTPFVLLMRTYPQLTRDAVITDDYQGAYEAVCQLARAGHRRIALVGGGLNISTGKSRWQGFRKALKVNGLPYEPDLVMQGDYRIESGYRCGHALLCRRPDGVFVANYLMTVGLLKAAEEMGLRCPEDFGLVSFDDYPWLALFHPRLTTVELPKYEMGFEAAERLLEKIANPHTQGGVRKLMPELRVRDSCGLRLHVAKMRAEDSPAVANLG
jgi:LacI family transcriptional regulator